MAKKDVIVLTCGKCGEDFLYEYSGRGAKPTYCPDCRQEVTRQARQAYKEKMKNERKERKLQRITNKKLEELAKNSFATTSPLSTRTYEGAVAELLKKLDTIRVELCTLATEMSEFQSGYDKNDQAYLHKLENIDTDNLEEIQALTKEWQISRNNRRGVKDLLSLVQNTIDKIPYKNFANALPILRNGGIFRK